MNTPFMHRMPVFMLIATTRVLWAGNAHARTVSALKQEKIRKDAKSR